MKQRRPHAGFTSAALMLLAAVLGCRQTSKQPAAEWTKARKVAGKGQRLSHISGLAVEGRDAYVTIGGTVADEREGTSGLRRVALDSGAVTTLDGENVPQSDQGGLGVDDKFIYWSAGGKILRVPKEGGKLEAVAAENVGAGIDIAVDDEKIYWANHSYYSPGVPAVPSPVYAVSKRGGRPEIFADRQMIPHALLVDEKFVYWVTPTSVLKQAKAGGGQQPQVVFQAADGEGVDGLAEDADSLYFGFRGAGESRWSLRKISKQGGAPQTLVRTYSPKPVAVDDANVYFFDEEGLTADLLCRVPKQGGEVTKLDAGYASGVVAQDKAAVYFASLDDIYSLSK